MRAWSLLLALVSVNAACAGYRPTPTAELGSAPAPEPVPGTPLERLWHARAARGPSVPVALDSVAAYLGGSGRNIAAVDLATGHTRWSVRLGAPLVGGAIRHGDLVLAGTDQPGGKVYALRAESGSEVWSRGVGYVTAPVTVLGTRVFAANREGQLVALKLADGDILWRRRVGPIRVAPIALDSSTLFVSAGDSLYRVGADSGKVLARVRAPAAVLAPWIRHGTQLIAGTADSTLVAIDQDSLRKVWELQLDAPVLATPLVRGDTILVATRIGTIYRAVAPPDGGLTRIASLDWPVTVGPALVGDWIVLGGADGVLRALTAAGDSAWSVSVGRPVEAAPIPLADGFLGLGGRGHLYRFRL